MTEHNFLNGQPLSANYYKILKQRSRLPVYEAKEQIQKLVRRFQCLLLVGETGSGKTTQVPQFLLEMGPVGCIACTQPRRVAAMSVSERVAEELDVTLGDEVGYTIRFEDVTSEKTRLKYLTDGMLLREAMIDPRLSKYSVIVLDEAHERTVATDILLGTVKSLLAARPDLRVVVMSATLEEKKFQHYFAEAPLIHIPGRMYGVELYYTRAPEPNYLEAAIRTVIQIHLHEDDGDILVFLCGEDEIETAIERIDIGIAGSNVEGKKPFVCLPLYSALPPQAQRKVFQKFPEGTRKIVVSTNIAETSLTVDGVVFVVDSGFSKQKVYNPRLCVESLLVTPVSQASANQRCGRAGRTRPGKCFRLYTEKAYETLLQAQTFPEMLRCNLGSVVLHMKKMGIDDLVHFDFVDPPAPETLMRALEMLNCLGAIDDDGSLTSFGERMSHFPVDPEMAAMLLRSERYQCAVDISCIAAMLSVQSPFVQSQTVPGRRAKEQFDHQHGDHLALLSVFRAYNENQRSQNWCRDNFLNPRTMKQAANVQRQLQSIMTHLGVDLTENTTEPFQFANHIRRAVLSGYFTQLAMALPQRAYFTTLKDSTKALVFPSSCLNRKPDFVVYHELVLTSQTYIRTVMAVSEDWIIDACPSYFDPADFEGLCQQAIVRLIARREANSPQR